MTIPPTRPEVALLVDPDPHCAEAVRASVRDLAVGIVGLINVLDPEAVILGGGMIQADTLLFDPLQDYLTKYEWRPGGHRVRIIPSELGDFAGAIGAARYGMMK